MIINILLTLIVALIMRKVLKKDIDKYRNVQNQDVVQEDYGWK